MPLKPKPLNRAWCNSGRTVLSKRTWALPVLKKYLGFRRNNFNETSNINPQPTNKLQASIFKFEVWSLNFEGYDYMHFNYIALDKLGKRLNGEVEAENTKAAADMLRAQALLPINISSEKSDVKKKFNVKNLFGKVPLVEKTSFIKNLAVMLKSGFPVSRALLVLSQQTSNVTLAEAIADISNQVQAGQPLAAAFARHPKVFSEMFVSMVKVGEVSGSLDQTLLDLGEQMKKDHDLIRKTRGAMIYPTVILTLMIVVGIVMFTFVLPKLTSLFLEFEVELPLVTRAIIGAVDFMEAFGVFILLALVALIVGAIYTLKIKSVRRLVDAAILRIPIIGKILMFTNLARFARTLSGLIKSGMPILDSIIVTGEALDR